MWFYGDEGMVTEEAILASQEYRKIVDEREQRQKEVDLLEARQRAKDILRKRKAQAERDANCGNDDPLALPMKHYWMGKPLDELEQAELLKAANYLVGEVSRLRRRV